MSIHNVEVGKFNKENIAPVEEKVGFLPFGDDFDEIAGFDEDDWNDTFEEFEKYYLEKEAIEDDEIDSDLK
jgi:hypothetical protein